MAVSLITISEQREPGLKTRAPAIGKKASPSHNFAKLLKSNGPSEGEVETDHSAAVSKDTKDTISGKHKKLSDHHEHKADQKETQSSKDDGNNHVISHNGNSTINVNHESDDDHENISTLPETRSSTISSVSASDDPSALKNMSVDDSSSDPKMNSSDYKGLVEAEGLNQTEDLQPIISSDDKKTSNTRGGLDKVKKDIVDHHMSVSDISLNNNDEINPSSSQKISLIGLQEQDPSQQAQPVSMNAVDAQSVSIEGQESHFFNFDSGNDLKKADNQRAGRKAKSPKAFSVQGNLLSDDKDETATRPSDEALLFRESKHITENSFLSEDRSSQKISSPENKQDTDSLFSDTLQGPNPLSDGTLKSEHKEAVGSPDMFHKESDLDHFETGNNLLPKTAHIPSTLNMTVTTDSKTSVHVQLTRLEDNLATLSLQGSDEATTEVLKKTRHDLISHLDAAGVQPAGIKIAVLPTDTSTMTGEKGHGSFDQGSAAFSGSSEQGQNQQNHARQEEHSGAVHSVETFESPEQNEKSSLPVGEVISSAQRLPSDLRRRGINISV